MHKIKLLLTFVVLGLLLSVGPSAVMAKELPPLQPQSTSGAPQGLAEARQKALDWIAEVSQHDLQLVVWVGATVSEPIQFVDLKEQSASLVFSVVKGEEEVGYITVGVQSGRYPILEYGLSPSPARNFTQVRDLAMQSLKTDESEMEVMFLHLGPMAYLAQFTAEIDRGIESVAFHLWSLEKVSPQAWAISPKGGPEAVGESPVAHSSAGLGAYTIPGVPYYIMDDVPGLHNHCGPTSGAMIYGYWKDHGFPNLWPGSAGALISALYGYMGTNQGHPGTLPGQYVSGMENYAHTHGYPGTDAYETYAGWDNYVAEINANRPVGIILWTDLHWITGVGWYESTGDYYLANHDCWDRNLHYLSYSEYYDEMEYVFVHPSA